ncbi:type IV pilus twitching motility protein PilT [Alkaliphilus pronyensis]|uniref:Type IV pilus twitching motility protein PilT n=1 Tax=Alkaliphilus pronyensis TaxID=1482732 RepID=A0A6I0FE61_9FIRM|nr:type IV pilus twitching motility protein PilT [Alkaliphilus pronyensis]KAB3537359.1 type IV pilus twitching motility protein PilT [Alkaliphilus pronyensis]
MNIHEMLERAIKEGASDIHITVAVEPTIRVNGSLISIGGEELKPEDTKNLVKQVLREEDFSYLQQNGEVDCSYSSPGLGRFRVNAFKQRGSYGMALRIVSLTIPTMEELGVPMIVKEMATRPRGLILVTGPTGSGKSTTLASMIDLINKEKNCHILTLEDPIEYLHKHNKSIVNQREIGNDSYSFSNALRSALRQDPDVILVGEMRDLETIAIAITAAETGHLVLSTLHTLGAAKTIDRIIDVFPPHQQQQIRVQLASVIQGIISQQLLPKADGNGRVAAFEVMTATPALRNLIREGKTHQIQNSIQTGSKFGMQTMDSSLVNLYKRNEISKETLLNQGMDREGIKRMIEI